MKWYGWAIVLLVVVVVISQVNRIRVMKDLSKVILSKNFTLAELVKTTTGLDNIPGPKEIEALRALCVHILQPLRDSLGVPVYVTNAYRSHEVNSETEGSSSTSQHPKGMAADIYVPGYTNQQIVDRIRLLRLPYDQLIDEERKKYDLVTGEYVRTSKWVHVSHNNTLPLYAQRLQWMTRRDTGPGRLKEYETVKIGLA